MPNIDCQIQHREMIKRMGGKEKQDRENKKQGEKKFEEQRLY